MTHPIPHLLRTVFNHDFSTTRDSADFHRHFFSKSLHISDLKHIFEWLNTQHITLAGKNILAAYHIKGTKPEGKPFAILAQLHGNEPAGLAGVALALALAEAELLTRDVIVAIGNPLATAQYFAAWQRAPDARQETRDAFRCGLDEQGNLLPDMNRIPVDFMNRVPDNHHTQRAQELFTIGQHISGIVDIHSARGNMVCITDHKRDADLKNSPIRAILTELADAISAHASANVTVNTFKTILSPLPNIESQTGIEAGRHEAPESPQVASSFTLSLLNTLRLTPVLPRFTNENGVFERYSVKPRITYADLVIEGSVQPDDKIYMACASTTANTLIPGYAQHQYEEMEPIRKGAVVAVAVPSGALLRAPYDFSGIFLSKSAALYDKDPNVGPWPVAADKLTTTKFCYPCEVSPMTLVFK